MTNEEFMAQRIASRARALTTDPEPPEATVAPIAMETPNERIVDGLRSALLGGETHYTDRPGMGELREHIARRLGPGIDESRDKDTVIVTNSDAEALFACLLGIRMAHADAGLLEARLPGGTEADAASLQSERDASLANLLGFRVSRSEGTTPRPWVGSFGVSDIRYDVLRLRGLDPKPLEGLENVEPGKALVIGAIELDGLAALPVGFASVPQTLAKAVRTWKQALSICTAAPSQRATLLALGSEP